MLSIQAPARAEYKRKEIFMSRTITFHFSGNCPYTNSKQTIDLDYFEINMVGNMTPGYKKGNYSCPHSEKCPYPEQDPYGRCPVYLSAPDKPH